MGIIFGQYDGTKSPLMKWYAEYTYERTSNTNVHVVMTVVGEIKNHKSTSYMGTGNGATVVVTATVDGVSKTYTLKQANETWQGDVNNPRSCSFEFDVASSTSGVSIPISYSVAPGRWTTASEVPTQSSSFSSPTLLYTPSTPEISNFHLGTSVPITIKQTHAELTHNVYWTLGERSGTVGTGIKNSVTFQTNVAWADQIPNATSGVGSIKCDTYAGDVLIGTRTIPFTAYVPDSVKPTCSVVVSLVNAYWGLAVKGYTKYKAEVAASGAYGSTISSYYISGGGYASSTPPYTSGVLNTVGDNKITVEVTDSRGRKGTAEATVKVYDYSPPSFSVAEAYRTDANKNKAKDGTYITTKATYSCSSVNGKNSVTCTVQYKKHLDASYTSAGSISSGGSVIFGNGALSLSAPYVVLLTLTDGIRNSSNPVTKEIPVGTMSRSFHIKKGGKGIGFGKIAETDNLVDSAWDIKAPNFQGKLNANDVVDASTMVVNAGTPTRKVIMNNNKRSEGYISRVALGLSNPSLAFSPALLSVGTNDGGTSWTDFTFETNGNMSSKAGTFVHSGNVGSYAVTPSNIQTYATPRKYWTSKVKGVTWSRLCYLGGHDLAGSYVLLNVRGMRTSVVYNDTFAITMSHYRAGTITKLSRSDYSVSGSYELRLVVSDDGNGYVEMKDNMAGATTSNEFSVYCNAEMFVAKECIGYTTVVSGETVPANCAVAASMEVTRDFENPPMVVGTEYLTTRFWNGKPLYTKLVEIGETPASGSSKSVNVAPAGSTIVSVSATGRSSDNLVCRTFPIYNNNGAIQATIRVTNQVDLTVSVHAWSFTSAYKVVAYVEYVKA